MSSTTTICLVRHGETVWNLQERAQGKTDIPLNETGKRQAYETARALAKERWEAVYSSPLERAYQTAQIIAHETEAPVIATDDGLAERSFGGAEGLTRQERRTRYPDGSIPDAEPWEEVTPRVAAAVQRIAEQHPGGRIIVVSHGGAIGCLLYRITDGTVDARRFGLRNAGMSLLAWEGQLRLLWCNRSAEDLEERGLRPAATETQPAEPSR